MRIVGTGGLVLTVALGGLLGCSASTSNATSGSGTVAGASTGGTTTGDTSGTTTGGGTTGTMCAAQGYHCFNPGVQSNCCSSLTCNDSNLCEPPASTTGGATTGSGTTGGGTTGSTGNATSGGSNDGGPCPAPSDIGGPCVTSVDCYAELVCTSDQGGGTCQTPAFPPISACLSVGTHCGGATDGICCGVCVNSACRDIGTTPCGSYTGAPCAATSDCCRDWACFGGGCQPLCGLENAPCDPANGNADCCVGEGLTCQGYGGDGGAPYECNNYYIVPAGEGCVTYCAAGGPPECELGAPCNPTASGLDNCVAAGLYCDSLNDVCVQPEYGDLCTEGGPPCGAGINYTNSNVTIQCIPNVYSGPACLQTCGSTKDCLFGGDSCCTTCTPSVCEFTPILSPCTTFFGSCDLQETGDGLCEPINLQGTLEGYCYQATTDGGKTGSACEVFANRQNPGFCDTTDTCSGGMCVPVCNVGTAGNGPACPDSNMVCVPEFGQTTDSDDFGYCVTPCDFVDGGGCTPPDGGVPEVCIPGLLLVGLPDVSTGYCIAQVADPVPVGSPCTPVDGSIAIPSPCVAGAICWNNPVPGGGFFCDRLCLVGTKCPDGTDCQMVNIAAGVYSSITGVCYPPGDAG